MGKATSCTQRGEAITLEQQVKGISEELKIFDRLIGENAAAVAAAETRLRMAKEGLPGLIARKEKARAERQKALASGNGQASAENLAGLAERIKAIETERELCEDEISGLTAMIEQLIAVGVKAKRDRQAAARRIPLAKFRDVAARYNALAEQLAPILAEFWRLRSELGEPVAGLVVSTPRGPVGALECVPRLFIPGTQDFEDSGDSGKHMFFDAPVTQEKRAQRVRPLTVVEDPEREVGS